MHSLALLAAYDGTNYEVTDPLSFIEYGVYFVAALAITISWSANQSILWAIVHGFLSWIYVIYFALSVRA